MATHENENRAVTEASVAANRGDPSWDVRRWLQQCGHATLSTLNVRPGIEGFPLGSVVPFAVDQQGRPYVLIADIAAHTKNLKQDSRAALFVQEPAKKGDPQAGWRASLVGRFSQLLRSDQLPPEEDLPHYAESVSVEEWSQLFARYVQRVPEAHSYLKMHGFHLWRMSEVEVVRYIAGFGRICWIKGGRYSSAIRDRRDSRMEAAAREHMNEDHVENMKEICRGLRQIEPEAVQMESLDGAGFLLRTEGPAGLHYFPFEEMVEEAAGYKSQIIRTLSQARRQARKSRG